MLFARYLAGGQARDGDSRGASPAQLVHRGDGERLHSLLVERNALYLHGHEHRVPITVRNTGPHSPRLRRRIRRHARCSATVNYRNSFAICELTELLHVAIYSWDSEYGQWRQSTTSRATFKKGVTTEGRYHYQFDNRVSRRPRHMRRLQPPYGPNSRLIRAFGSQKITERWTEILRTIGALPRSTRHTRCPISSLPAGHCQFRVSETRAVTSCG